MQHLSRKWVCDRKVSLLVTMATASAPDGINKSATRRQETGSTGGTLTVPVLFNGSGCNKLK